MLLISAPPSVGCRITSPSRVPVVFSRRAGLPPRTYSLISPPKLPHLVEWVRSVVVDGYLVVLATFIAGSPPRLLCLSSSGMLDVLLRYLYDYADLAYALRVANLSYFLPRV